MHLVKTLIIVVKLVSMDLGGVKDLDETLQSFQIALTTLNMAMYGVREFFQNVSLDSLLSSIFNVNEAVAGVGKEQAVGC